MRLIEKNGTVRVGVMPMVGGFSGDSGEIGEVFREAQRLALPTARCPDLDEQEGDDATD